jgi:hypothetical protein
LPPPAPVATSAPVEAPAPPVVHPAARHIVVKRPHAAPAHRRVGGLKTDRRVFKPLFAVQAHAASEPSAPTAIPWQPPAGVTLVPPSEVSVASVGGNSTPMVPSSAPPKAPTLPPAPSSPTNDSPISFGGAFSGPAGAAILLFAALAAILSILPPWLTSRVAMAVAAPVEYRRRLSLERPG